MAVRPTGITRDRYGESGDTTPILSTAVTRALQDLTK